MPKTEFIHDEKHPCINCENARFAYVFDGMDRMYHIEGDFKILRCVKCGLFTLRPKLTPLEVSKYYPENYLCYLSAIEDETNFFSKLNRSIGLNKRVNRIIRIAGKPGKILDVGCATGILLNGLAKKDFECFGVEPNFAAAEYARSRFGLNVQTGLLTELHFENETFDIITMMDVLEHTYETNMILQKVYQLLKPGGVLIGTMPNASSYGCKFFGPFWVGWEVPRHYHVFSINNFPSFLKKQGFEDIKLFGFTGRHGDFMLSIQFWLDSVPMRKWMKTIIIKILGSLIIRIMMLPIFWGLEKIKRSTTIAFSAKKPN